MSKLNGHKIYEFDEFRLDVDRLMLCRGGTEVPLPPKVVKTLSVLVENRGEILSKDELINSVWGDSFVEESNLTQHLYLLRKTLGTRPGGEPYIETLRCRGYRFVADVVGGKTKADPAPDLTLSQTHSGRYVIERDGNVLTLADWKPEPSPESSATTLSPVQAATPARRSSFLPKLAMACVLFATGGAGLIYFWPRLMPVVTSSERAREISITRLTDGRTVYGATISPDGGYFVYSEYDRDRSGIFVQQTGQNPRTELVSSPEQMFHGATFSPDGRAIYYLASKKGDTKLSLFRVAVIGGASTKVLDNVGGSVSFSPDGREFAFSRVIGPEDTTILIADRDGRAERVLVHRRGERTIGSNPAWSPDGKVIVFAEVDRTRLPAVSRLRMVDASTGLVSPLADEGWSNIFRVEWVPDGSGIVLIGTRAVDHSPVYRDNIFFVSYPDGVSRRITNDGHRYNSASLGVSKDGTLLAAPDTRSCQIWSMRTAGDAATAVQITNGSADGRAGLVPLSDGRIAYTSRTGDELTIWISNEDGSDARQVMTGFPFNEELRADPAGRFLVFSTFKDSASHLFRIDPDGRNLKQLTFGDSYEVDSTISPDGKTIVTHSDDVLASPLRMVLKKLSEDGGEPQTLATENCRSPLFSPDGSMISCIRNETEIVIVTASDGREVESLPMPPLTEANFGAVWLPDATGLVIRAMEKGRGNNLLVIPRGGRKPYRLTNFRDGAIYRFAFSHDGGRLYLARGFPTQDAVLIKNAF